MNPAEQELLDHFLTTIWQMNPDQAKLNQLIHKVWESGMRDAAEIVGNPSSNGPRVDARERSRQDYNAILTAIELRQDATALNLEPVERLNVSSHLTHAADVVGEMERALEKIRVRTLCAEIMMDCLNAIRETAQAALARSKELSQSTTTERKSCPPSTLT